MKKITTMFLMGIFFVAIVGAAVSLGNYDFVKTDVSLSQKVQVNSTMVQFAYDCEGEIKYFEIRDEKVWQENDFLGNMRSNCTGEMAWVEKEGVRFKKNMYGDKSFSQLELDIKGCARNDNNKTLYDSKTSGCVEPEVEEDLGEAQL